MLYCDPDVAMADAWHQGSGDDLPASHDRARSLTIKSSFPPVVDARTRVLILGSLPGERSLADQRYYAHPQNQFWRLVGTAIECDLVALSYGERLARLLARGIGLWDVVARARRTGSSDAAIRDMAANDLAELVDRLPRLCAIAFNGGLALSIGKPLLAGRSLAALALPSSSPLHTIGIAAKQPAWNAIVEHLDDRADALT